MKNTEIRPDDFIKAITQASDSLRSNDIETSRAQIANAMALNMDAPQPHNLLGILYELIGDDSGARKHYRAAYALAPTYKPACRNLERLVLGEWEPRRNYDYGIGSEEPVKNKMDWPRVAL
jgi:Flp pilus assembly protein TadD